eukprot:jgi/Psemu1/53088/gm1.53088_g
MPPERKKRPTGFTSRLRKREKKSTVLLREQRLLKQMQLEEAVDAEAAALPEDPPEEPEEEEDSKLPARSPTVNYEEEDDLQEEVIAPEDYWEEPPHLAASSPADMRISIAFYFENILKSPPEHLWKKKKTIASIANIFDLSNRRSFRDTVKQVCRDVVLCQQVNLPYTGKGNYQAVGRKCVIPLDSVEAEVIADALESGNSINMSTYIVNQYREKNELPSLTYSAVRGCMNRLKPQILSIKKGKQGSKNIEHAWCRASFRWVAQLLLRFGKVKFSHPMFSKLLEDAYDVENPPACYDETLLTPLSLSKI